MMNRIKKNIFSKEKWFQMRIILLWKDNLFIRLIVHRNKIQFYLHDIVHEDS